VNGRSKDAGVVTDSIEDFKDRLEIKRKFNICWIVGVEAEVDSKIVRRDDATCLRKYNSGGTFVRIENYLSGLLHADGIAHDTFPSRLLLPTPSPLSFPLQMPRIRADDQTRGIIGARPIEPDRMVPPRGNSQMADEIPPHRLSDIHLKRYVQFVVSWHCRKFEEDTRICYEHILFFRATDEGRLAGNRRSKGCQSLRSFSSDRQLIRGSRYRPGGGNAERRNIHTEGFNVEPYSGVIVYLD
jgi:hypothetical protein